MEIFLRYGTVCVLSLASAALCYLRVEYWGWYLAASFVTIVMILDRPLSQNHVSDEEKYICADPDNARSEARVRNYAFVRFGSHKYAALWMEQKNPEFGGKTPIEMIKEGKTTVLVDFLSGELMRAFDKDDDEQKRHLGK